MDTEIINFASNNAWFLTHHIARPREIELAKLDCVTKCLTESFHTSLTAFLLGYNNINLSTVS